mmetsp:Transcript_42390/g.130863  ORF Transcript_42390/g.130863 Transcript_42390/m.130863 type:complete len:238 (-) Transcript_42390:544-1257(-)
MARGVARGGQHVVGHEHGQQQGVKEGRQLLRQHQVLGVVPHRARIASRGGRGVPDRVGERERGSVFENVTDHGGVGVRCIAAGGQRSVLVVARELAELGTHERDGDGVGVDAVEEDGSDALHLAQMGRKPDPNASQAPRPRGWQRLLGTGILLLLRSLLLLGFLRLRLSLGQQHVLFRLRLRRLRLGRLGLLLRLLLLRRLALLLLLLALLRLALSRLRGAVDLGGLARCGLLRRVR